MGVAGTGVFSATGRGTHTLRGRGGPTMELKRLRFQTYPLPGPLLRPVKNYIFTKCTFLLQQAFQTTYGTGAPDLRPPRLMCSGAAEVCGYEKLGQLAAGGQDQPRRPQLGGGTSEQTTPLLP